MNTAQITTNVPLDCIKDSLCDSLSTQALVQFVKDLDEEEADWSFTEACYEFFKAEMAKRSTGKMMKPDDDPEVNE